MNEINNTILETPRLRLRPLVQADFDALCAILQDAETMAAYEHAFSDEEVQAWLENQQRRYRQDGFGLWAMVLKETGEVIGQCGITWQLWGQRRVPEIGYLLHRSHWHHGYATEAAAACKRYAFYTLGFPEIYSIIRDTNAASQAVALRNGMQPRGTFVKHYWGMDMPHIVYSAQMDRP